MIKCYPKPFRLAILDAIFPMSGLEKTRYLSLSNDLRHRFGGRVQKIPLDAGFTCPNRDGTLSHTGCVFCNPGGSGTGNFSRGVGLEEQWDILTARLGRKYKTSLFLAYLQSYSNTYCSVDRLRQVLEEIRPLGGRVGLCLGTRPDCLDDEKLALLAGAGLGELWLDLGLQSCNDATLRRINRGHDASCFERTCRAAAKRGIKVCAHVIAGLPGEGGEDLLRTVEYLNALPVAGIKFHNVYVCKGAALAGMWKKGDFEPPGMQDYVHWLCRALANLRPDIVVHRLASDPAPGELLAPEWAGNKEQVLGLLYDLLEIRDIRQGCMLASGLDG